MPFVTITSSARLDAGKKQALIQAVCDAVVRDLSAPVPSVRIMLHELAPGHYMSEGRMDVPALLFSIDMLGGRSDEAKANIIRSLSKVGHEVAGVSEDEIRTLLCDFPSTNMGMAKGITAKAAGR